VDLDQGKLAIRLFKRFVGPGAVGSCQLLSGRSLSTRGGSSGNWPEHCVQCHSVGIRALCSKGRGPSKRNMRFRSGHQQSHGDIHPLRRSGSSSLLDGCLPEVSGHGRTLGRGRPRGQGPWSEGLIRRINGFGVPRYLSGFPPTRQPGG